MGASLWPLSEEDRGWEELRRREFPGAQINLNAGTLGTPARAVLAAQRGFWRGGLRAWPLGQYQRGRTELRRARALAAELWGGAAGLALCGGTSEVMTRISLALQVRRGGRGLRVLTSGHEHAGGLRGLAGLPGCELRYLPDQALSDPARVAAAVAAWRPQVLFLSQVTYTKGQVVPVEQHAAAARAVDPELWVIVDAAQALGLTPPALAGADVAVASGHKWLFGPPGSGFLWLSARAREELGAGAAGEALDPEAPCAAFERAGGHDLSVHAGVGAALALHQRLGPARVLARCGSLASLFATALHEALRGRGIAHGFFDPWSGEMLDEPAPLRPLGSVHVQLLGGDPYPAYAALDARGIHLKCIKRVDPSGRSLALLRACLPCYESPRRVLRACAAIAAALGGGT